MNNKQYAHNKGQEHHKKGVYKSPNNLLFGLFNTSSQDRENGRYEKGWNHRDRQKKRY